MWFLSATVVAVPIRTYFAVHQVGIRKILLLGIFLYAVCFLFYIAAHIELKPNPLYKKLRTRGILVYFIHDAIKQKMVMAAPDILSIKNRNKRKAARRV